MPGRRIVLLVDDNDHLRERVRRQLNVEEYDVLEAPTADEGAEIARDIRPDVVVTDLEMPGMDGLTFCRILRELRAFDGVPLVLCTSADAQDDRVREARMLVGVTVVHKPIDGHEMAAVLDDLIGVPAIALEGRAAGMASNHSSGLLARQRVTR